MRFLATLLASFAFGFSPPSAFAYDVDAFLSDAASATSIEDALARLPLEMRRSYTLQHHGDGLQAASMENPRVIAYSQVGDFVLTFNGDANQPGFDRFEALQYRPETKKFELYEISFAASKLTVNKNPGTCVRCHGPNNDPHPIWNGYARWTNLFGSDPERPDFPTALEAERLKSFNRMLSGPGPKHSRYGVLQPMRLGTLDITPYTGPRGATVEARDLDYSPNFRLGLFLFRRMSAALTERMRVQPLYESLLPLTFYAVNCAPKNPALPAFTMPDRSAFVVAHPDLAEAYDRTARTLTRILKSQSPNLTDGFKYLRFMGLDPAALTMQTRQSSTFEGFYDDGLTSRLSHAPAFYPGALLDRLKELHPAETAAWMRGRDRDALAWTSNPAVLDRLDAIETLAEGGRCEDLWPLIVKTTAMVTL